MTLGNATLALEASEFVRNAGIRLWEIFTFIRQQIRVATNTAIAAQIIII